MKAFVVLLAVLALVWLINGPRRRLQTPPTTSAPPRTGPTPQPPLATCAQCGVYLPHDEALPGRGGLFCSDEHRHAFELAHRVP